MADASLELLLRRDRTLVAASLLALTALAWAYVLWLAATTSMPMMGSMADMSDMIMAPVTHPWTLGQFAFTFAMWAVMMVGMMTPSAAPMILLYARVGRQARAEGKPFAATAWFAGGYLLAWSAFAALATVAQSILVRAALLTPMLTAANTAFGALVLIAAGIYQWTPFKDSCLSQCQTPLAFIQRHGGFKRDTTGSLLAGLKHGAFCVGCCWGLMALLFVGGIMNVALIAGLSILVLVEKLVRAGRVLPRAVGLFLIIAGVVHFLGE